MHYDFFLASRFRNKDTVLELTEKIRAKNKSVYCFIEGNETDLTPEEYMQKFENTPDWRNNSAIKAMFETDMNALKNSKSLILLLPAGNSAHIEAGVAYGMNKHCIVIGEKKEADSLYLIFNEHYETIDDFINSLP